MENQNMSDCNEWKSDHNDGCYADESIIFVGNEIEINSSNSIIEKEEEGISEDECNNSANNTLENKGQQDVLEKPIGTVHLSVHDLANDDDAIHFYTGLEDYQKLQFVFFTLGQAVCSLNYFYETKPELDVMNQFFLSLIILRQHKTDFELSLLFKISEKQVANIFMTWIRFMKLQWSTIPQWPSKNLVRFFTPIDFNNKFPGTRCIIDRIEIPIEKPSTPTSQQNETETTVKSIVAATPGGLISYVSSTYAGSTSDREIIEDCGLLSKCDPGDSIMACKDFDIQDILAEHKIKLNVPKFFKEKTKISSQTVLSDEEMSSEQVHVERIIGLSKTYKILQGPLRKAEICLADDIIFTCFMLCNFRNTISPEA